jgi:hypothetical protein
MISPAKKGHIFAPIIKTMFPLLIHLFVGLFHPFFVSVTEINHNKQDKSLEISIRVFTDDFENTLRMYAPDKKVDLMNPPANGAMDSLVKSYIQSKIRVEVNGSGKSMQYIGFERVEESIWAYFEITGIAELKKLKIKDPILYEYKKEQINMVHVITGDKRQSRKLDNPVADWEFNF